MVKCQIVSISENYCLDTVFILINAPGSAAIHVSKNNILETKCGQIFKILVIKSI